MAMTVALSIKVVKGQRITAEGPVDAGNCARFYLARLVMKTCIKTHRKEVRPIQACGKLIFLSADK
jgi:hypothetical protein